MSMIMCMKIKEQHFPIISFAACVYLFTKVELTRFTTNEWYFLVGSSTKVADRFPVAPTLSNFSVSEPPSCLVVSIIGMCSGKRDEKRNKEQHSCTCVFVYSVSIFLPVTHSNYRNACVT